MPFGTPVVPDEYSTYSGWSNGSGVKAGAVPACRASSASQSCSGTGAASTRHAPYGTATTCSAVGRPARISATAARRSCALPL
jgi:hypothetical protein